MTEPTSNAVTPTTTMLLLLPHELQVHILTYLRAYDLSALHQTCKYYADPHLVHAVVMTTAEHVYPTELTDGFAASCPRTSSSMYTLGHLRHMEWLVVARVLSRPEPKSGGGFYISKSWCRTALQWLEAQQQRQEQLQQQQQQGPSSNRKAKKLARKQKLPRNYAKTAGDAPPAPWPDVNSDLLCCHDQLQRCTNSKSARAKRRLVDKQAWKAIQKLYPNSTPLSAVQGECVHCRLELETKNRAEEERLLQMKTQRKQPLNNPVLRRFYTRTRGVPTHCLVQYSHNRSKQGDHNYNDHDENSLNDYSERESIINHPSGVPLIPGRYYILPRAWCQAWRHYIKTGDTARGNIHGNHALSTSSSQTPSAPDASALLCDAHRVPVLPPHLEAYLHGQTNQLFASTRGTAGSAASSMVASPHRQGSSRIGVVGMAVPELDPATLRQLQAAGMSQAELLAQRTAMLELEQQQRLRQLEQQRLLAASSASSPPLSAKECLDRENYIVVEILCEEEYQALEALWPELREYNQIENGDDRKPSTLANRSSSFSRSGLRGSGDCVPSQVWFDVHPPSFVTDLSSVSFCSWPCRECEASGLCHVSSKIKKFKH